jgi:hypothetical protein
MAGMTSSRARSIFSLGAATLMAVALAGCRTTDANKPGAADPSLSNRGAPQPYMRGSVRPDGTYVRPYMVNDK